MAAPTLTFFDISAWNQTAEYVANYLTKGRLVAVDGRLQTRKYTTQSGDVRTATEIVADNVQGLDRPKDEMGGGGGGGGYQRAAVPAGAATAVDEYDPFAEE